MTRYDYEIWKRNSSGTRCLWQEMLPGGLLVGEPHTLPPSCAQTRREELAHKNEKKRAKARELYLPEKERAQRRREAFAEAQAAKHQGFDAAMQLKKKRKRPKKYKPGRTKPKEKTLVCLGPNPADPASQQDWKNYLTRVKFMTQKAIFEAEQLNPGDLVQLRREGAFWKAYERSAFVLINHVKKCKPTKKWIKSIKREVVSAGFPNVALEDVKLRGQVLHEDPVSITLQIDKQTSTEEFIAWKDKLEQIESLTERKRARTIGAVEQAIMDFDLAERTPIECLTLIADLKSQLRTR